MRSTFLAGMSTAKPHGMPESGAPEKYPKPAKGGTRGPWPKGGNFLGKGTLPVGGRFGGGRSAPSIPIVRER